MDKCYFDKRGIFIDCDRKEKECDGCKYEKVIAQTFSSLCHYCSREITARTYRAFCNKDCRNNWQRDRMSYDSEWATGGGLFWTEGDGVCPIFTKEELEEVQIKMLGSPVYNQPF